MIKKLFCIISLMCNVHLAYALQIGRDQEIEDMFQEIGTPLLKAAGMNPQHINYYLVIDEEINAMVTSSSDMYIHTGLLNFSDDYTVLAGVMAHEIGHIVGRHNVMRMEDIYNVQARTAIAVLAGAILGFGNKSSDAALGTTMLGIHLGNSSIASFTRAQESAADQHAIKILKKTNITPNGILKLFKHFMQREKLSSNDMAYYRTHPLSRDRLQAIENSFAHSLVSDVKYQKLSSTYKRVHAKSIAYTMPIKEVLHKFSNTNDIDHLYAQAIAKMRAGQKEQSITLADKMLQIEPKNPYFWELLAELYWEKGEVKKAANCFEEAIKLHPKASVIMLSYGAMLLNNQHDDTRGISILNEVMRLEDENIIVYQMLAGLYRRIGQIDLYNLHMAYFYAAIGNIDKAKKHFAIVPKTMQKHDVALRLESLL